MSLVQLPTPSGYFDLKAWGEALITALNITFSTSREEVGAIQEFRGHLPESGYLLANGATFDGNSYPELAARLGTTTLPNLASAYGAGNVVGIKT